ncbi:hypothetical protein MKW98_029302 [Papaver atlanticum]|uniref:Uncharacterized protein n=1 Tax=Papaver atlanticum TaxID=357466 RepID=A0AAD4SKL6_9MAGN|nr:hypothetical protein MKW98_029302 [Papaver atlanticum]
MRREITRKNLHAAGYKNWKKLILKIKGFEHFLGMTVISLTVISLIVSREPSDSKKTAVMFKSEKRAKLVKQGYRIQGNIGDQWSDLLGTDIGSRTFKLPDPMYYIA